MKNGWQTKRLGEVATVSTGPFGSILHKADYVNDGVPLVNPINIVNDSIVPDPTKLISESTKKRLSSYVLERGDIVIGRRGEIGRCAVVGPNEAGWLCGTGSFFLRPLASINSQFLAYLIRSASYREKLEQASTGTTMMNLSNTALANLVVSVPSFSEQCRIVGILNEAFDSIATAKANAEKNLQNARALFESTFCIDFTRCAEWKEKLLADVVDDNCSLSYGIVQPGEEYPNGLPVVRPTDLTRKVIQTEGLKRIDPALAASYRRTTLAGGELLLCVRGSTGMISIASDELAGANVTRGIVPIRFNPFYITRKFGYYLLASENVQAQIRKKTYGAALMQINIRDLRSISVLFPSLQEQQSITKKLDALAIETRHLESIYRRKLAALDELKKSLLHKAFTGEL